MTTTRKPRPRTPEPAADMTAAVLRGELSPRMTFNQRVWALTVRIPAGRVATYGQIARQLGCGSARAVGQALHRNPHAPAVPCHRVVGHDGSLTGFAGGLDQKRALLQQEGVPIVGSRVTLQVCRHAFQ